MNNSNSIFSWLYRFKFIALAVVFALSAAALSAMENNSILSSKKIDTEKGASTVMRFELTEPGKIRIFGGFRRHRTRAGTSMEIKFDHYHQGEFVRSFNRRPLSLQMDLAKRVGSGIQFPYTRFELWPIRVSNSGKNSLVVTIPETGSRFASANLRLTLIKEIEELYFHALHALSLVFLILSFASREVKSTSPEIRAVKYSYFGVSIIILIIIMATSRL